MLLTFIPPKVTDLFFHPCYCYINLAPYIDQNSVTDVNSLEFLCKIASQNMFKEFSHGFLGKFKTLKN